MEEIYILTDSFYTIEHYSIWRICIQPRKYHIISNKQNRQVYLVRCNKITYNNEIKYILISLLLQALNLGLRY